MLEVLCKDIQQTKKDLGMERRNEIDDLVDETSTAIEVVKGTFTFSECVDRFAILLSARLDFKRSGSRIAMLGQTKSRASSQTASQTTRSQATQSQDGKTNKVIRKQSNHARLGDQEFGEILGEIRKKMTADARY